MKALCCGDGMFRGKIADAEVYEKVKDGELDWKPHIKPYLKSVEIPYDVFCRLLELDRAVTKDGRHEKITFV